MNARLADELEQLAIPAELQQCLDAQRAAHLANPMPSHAERVHDLRQLALLLKENQAAIVEAIAKDYGCRSEFETLFAEYFMALETIKDSIKKLRRWMKPQRRHVDVLLYPGASNRVIPQPLGVVGVIVPWNFPLNLSFCPLAAIFAAGNRAMVKMSENSRHLAELLICLSPQYLPEHKLRFFADSEGGGAGRGPAFSSLRFDHLLFTGSGSTGRAVMANAAKNLVPVTLELGGKSPAIVGPDFPIETAAARILWAKLFNAGQICTSIDYVFLPEGSQELFTQHCRRLVAERYPDLNNGDYTALIDQPAYERLQGALDDARAKGATVIDLAPDQQPDAARRIMSPHLVFDLSPDMLLAQRETFGPILAVRSYRDREEVLRYINAQDRPLALYPFTKDKQLQQYYLDRVMSGGVSINEGLLHVGQHDLPFGGVGPSGMGHYHGREGFITFSKLRPVFRQGFMSGIQLLFQPPYRGRTMQLLKALIRWKAGG